ncbi:TIGR03364 family FAD-dependent oxidoreductase [Leifsonia sp. NPDC058230]|uniref:TIGR03364 family FAD-dependent oxidoreductase n=1 Tax=Leifsonia sp. NPDC058230 TaxID=3346391 RepID=UPI0036D7DB93
MTAKHYDLAVVGAGIVGLGHAVAALRRGLTVAVVDRASTIGGASVRNFGHLCLTAQDGEAREYAELARELWLTLAPAAGFWLKESGTVVVARADDELAVLSEFQDARGDDEVRMLSAGEVRELVPVGDGVAVGGAMLPRDLQVDPREASLAIAQWLEAHGVDFFWSTAVLAVETGVVHTTRGRVAADAVVVAVNYDVDLLFPGIAEAHGIQRCGLDMLLVDADLERPLSAPLLTGWSLLRYAGFTGLSSAAGLRARLADEHPELLALDLNQMYTQRPDGSLIVGDTHYRGADVPPFQSEAAFDALLEQARLLFGTDRIRVRERWQGVYASAPDEFLLASPAPQVRVVSVTTGIGMTTGLGFAERVVGKLFSSAPALAGAGTAG